MVQCVVQQVTTLVRSINQRNIRKQERNILDRKLAIQIYEQCTAHIISCLSLFFFTYVRMLATHLGDQCSNPDWHTLHSQIVLPMILIKQLLVQSQELGGCFTACSNFIEKTAGKQH